MAAATLIVQWDPSAPESPEWVHVAVLHPGCNPTFAGVLCGDDPVARRALDQASHTPDGWRELHLTKSPWTGNDPQWCVRWESITAERGHLLILDGAEEVHVGSIRLAAAEFAGDADLTAEGSPQLPLARVHAPDCGAESHAESTHDPGIGQGA